MIVALQIGKGNSIGVPGKNLRKTLGRSIMEYPLMAASDCELVEKIYVSTDCPNIAKVGTKYGAIHIERPLELALPETLTEDVLSHALSFIRSDLKSEPELICLLFCNVATTTSQNISKAIKILRADDQQNLDSVFSVAEFNMFAPMRARKLDSQGMILPYVDMNIFDQGTSSIRDDNEDCFFADFAIQVIRPSCIDNIDQGLPPVKWMGKSTKAIITDYGFDIDKPWQFPAIEMWLENNGFSEKQTPYERKYEQR